MGSRHDFMLCCRQGELPRPGAQSPQELLGFGILLFGCRVTRPQGMLYLYLVNFHTLSFKTHVFPEVHSQAFGKHLTANIHSSILIMQQALGINLEQQFERFTLFSLHLMVYLGVGQGNKDLTFGLRKCSLAPSTAGFKQLCIAGLKHSTILSSQPDITMNVSWTLWILLGRPPPK